jgi:hypothetical protein
LRMSTQETGAASSGSRERASRRWRIHLRSSSHGRMDDQMPRPVISRIETQTNTYTGYSIGSAAVWAVILAAGRRMLDAEAWKTLRLACGGWWTGWASATIARAVYPPPKKLSHEADTRLRFVSIALIALGFISVIRLLVTRKRPETSAADA